MGVADDEAGVGLRSARGGGKRRTAGWDARRLRGVVEQGVDEPIARHGVQHAAHKVIERRVTPAGLTPEAHGYIAVDL